MFVPQGVLIWLIGMPLQVSALAGPGVRAVLAAGVLVWMVGLVFEAVGDAQLARFKADPANRGRLITTGLCLDAAPELLRRRLRVVGAVPEKYGARTSGFVPRPPR